MANLIGSMSDELRRSSHSSAGSLKVESMAEVMVGIQEVAGKLDGYGEVLTAVKGICEMIYGHSEQLKEQHAEVREIAELTLQGVKSAYILSQSKLENLQNKYQNVGSAPEESQSENSARIAATGEGAEELERYLEMIQELTDRLLMLETELKGCRDEARELAAENNVLKQGNVEVIKQSLAERERKIKALEEQATANERILATSSINLAQINKRLDEAEKLHSAERRANLRLNEAIHQLQGDIRVMCRIRPLLPYESEEDRQDFGEEIEGDFNSKWAKFAIPEQSEGTGVVRLTMRKLSLERIFGPAETNADVFEELEHLLLSALSGKIATIFAYGASGTGKSHTLSYQQNENSQDPDRDGIIPRLIAMMFKHAEEEQAVSSYQFSLSATEIYLDDMYDLLSRHRVAPKIALGEESWVEVADWISANTVIARVSEKRQQAETKVNVRSSRSHLTLRFRIQRTSVNNDDDRCVFGQINIVDLAGSESISDKTGQRHAEGQSINKSLGDLVSILEQLGKGQRPYPTTTLGKTLRAAFEKPAKVAMLITVSPLKKGYPSTRATLRTAETAHKARKDPLARPRTRKISAQDTNAEPGTPYTPTRTTSMGRGSLSGNSSIPASVTPASRGPVTNPIPSRCQPPKPSGWGGPSSRRT